MKYGFIQASWFVCALGCGESAVNMKDREPIEEKKVIISCSPQTTDTAWYTSGAKAPKLPGLDGIDFKISTSSREAQEYFNQGMMLSYGFNHAEAARSFFEATRLDSTCAMAWWGFAYVLGPNYNAGMEADNYQRAYQATQRAMNFSGSCSEKEKALILALTHRYAPQPPEDRGHLDSAYAHAMKRVYQQYPNDPDIAALYAESLMDLHPWDLYDKKTKAPRPWTAEIVAVLEKIMTRYPKHPGAPHFYIHAVEASKNPERGLAAANLLMTLVPGAGHLVHMPSHIYNWTGDYHRGVVANLEAVKVDSTYLAACHAQGAYPLAYYPHNYHYLAAMATLEGNASLAWQAAKKVQSHAAQEVMMQPGWATLQHYYTIPWFVGVKLGMWDSLLAVKPLPGTWIYPRAVLHYARGMAYLGKGHMANATSELEQLRALAKNPSLKELTIWDINSMHDIVQIALNVLTAEMHRRNKNFEKSIASFKRAIEIEDNLNYNEPPDWFFSVRHHLGRAFLEAGKYADAEKVYAEDLHTWKENGWALRGLHQALQKQGKLLEAKQALNRFKKAWSHADIDISALD